jgi:hypothetical protein
MITTRIKCKDCDSIGIKKRAAAKGKSDEFMILLDQNGEGDARVRLWRTPWNQWVIETNGDPIWEFDKQSMQEECIRLGLTIRQPAAKKHNRNIDRQRRH